MKLPALLTGSFMVYRFLFSSLMALLLTAAVLACRRCARSLPAPIDSARLVLLATAAALAIGKIATHRYDAVLSLGLCVMLLSCFARRPIAVGATMGLSLATKLVPVVVAPLFIVFFVRTRRYRELLIATLATAAVATVICLPAVVSVGADLLDVLRYHRDRPLQVESTAAAVLALVRALDPSSLDMVRSFGSTNVVGRFTPFALRLLPVLTAAGLMGVYALTWVRLADPDPRRRHLRLLEGACAALVVFAVFGKVFSPQYLVWLIPLGALASLAHGSRACALFLGVMLLTQIIFPGVYGDVEELKPWACALVLVRNALLLVWAGSLLRCAPPEPSNP